MRSTLNVPARSWPNRKLAPTHTSATCSQSTSTVRTNTSGSHSDSSRVKRDDGDPLHTRARERLELLILGHQQRRRLVGPQHPRRMRLEGHRRGRAAALAGAPPDAVDDLHVPAMQPVEIPQRQHRIVPARRADRSGKWAIVHQSAFSCQLSAVSISTWHAQGYSARRMQQFYSSTTRPS